MVEWQDADTEGGWFDDDDESLPVLKTFGLYVRKNKDSLTLASTYDPHENSWSDKMRIPWGMVIKVTTIQEVEYEVTDNP